MGQPIYKVSCGTKACDAYQVEKQIALPHLGHNVYGLPVALLCGECHQDLWRIQNKTEPTT